MCGLFGYNVKKWDDRLYFAMAILSVMNETRGTDAFGWTNGKVIVKDDKPASRLFPEIPFEGDLVGSFHTRQGTTGPKVGTNTAHPWQVGDVIGMHNGFVSNHDELNKKYNRKCVVDSEHMIYHTAEGRKYEDVDFAGVFVFFEAGEGPFMFKTSARQFDVALLKDGLGIVWSSEYLHLTRALDIAGLDVEFVYKAAETHRIHELSADGLLILPEEPLKFYERPPVPVYTGKGRKGKDGFVHYGYGGWSPEADEELAALATWYRGQEEKNTRGATDADTRKSTRRIRDGRIGRYRNDIDGTEVWSPCFHSWATEYGHKKGEYTCGCFYNTKHSFSAGVPTVWRDFGYYNSENRWFECNHTDISKKCDCVPFAIKTQPRAVLPAPQEGDNTPIIIPAES